MSADLFALARPLLHALDPEKSHQLTIAALRTGLIPSALPDDSRLATQAFGKVLSNPIGLAAGFDKDGEVPDRLIAIGFGFAEIGTVTPKPQSGNLKPRLFRLKEDAAIINRLGFNNQGHDSAAQRLERLDRKLFIGVNIGANKDSTDRIGDYVLGVRRFADLASYLTVNISSPNTPGLRDLQTGSALRELLERVLSARAEAAAKLARPVPLMVKVSPDLADEDLDEVALACLRSGVDGMIISNTTITRPPLRSMHGSETGGLSGSPLFVRSTRALARVYRRTEGRILLVGVGGVSSAATAIEKVRAGASLIQLYTALTFKGPRLLTEIKQGLLQKLSEQRLSRLADLTGTGADEWAERPLLEG